ncbi:actin-related protein 10 [Helicoverpa zea]|uniref:actin-related protein 10 n=1 Tax=Helicoverpa zea TaxID=7113 RepID=UPI001F56DB59|nr:actin-related protein 10 [Helicoverpa zea]
MALYEGIALIQEKQAVVLDLGTDYTKFGFTGEAAPRCIVRSQFWCARERRLRRVHDYRSPDELYDNLVQMLHLLYFRHVLVNPKERKVVVVESLLTPTLFRETLAKVLFTHYEVSGVIWADRPRLSALTLGAAAALVVALGAREAEVAPVLHAALLLPALQAQPLGARAVHAELARLLDEHHGAPLALSDEELEDIKVKTCFVIPRARALQWQSGSPPAAARDVACGRVLVPGRVRELAAEALFARDAELGSLGDAVLQCLARCPRDARRPLAESIVLTGGGAALPGLRARLAAELRALVAEEPYASRLHVRTFKFHTAPAQPNSVAWLGGALLGAGEAGAARAQAREQYAREPRLRDWVCLLDNTPPAHPQRLAADM